MQIFIQPRPDCQLPPGPVHLRQMALCVGLPEAFDPMVGSVAAGQLLAVDAASVLEAVQTAYPEDELHWLGPARVWVQAPAPGRMCKTTRGVLTALCCLIMLIGGALAIMNFHADVDMPAVQRTLFRALTGREDAGVIGWVSIPYSIGLGLGAMLFFGHFKTRTPDPLQLKQEAFERDTLAYRKEHAP